MRIQKLTRGRDERQSFGSAPTRLDPEIGDGEGFESVRNRGKPLSDEVYVGEVEIVGLVLHVFEGDAAEGAVDAERHGFEVAGEAHEACKDGIEGGDEVLGLRRTGLEVAGGTWNTPGSTTTPLTTLFLGSSTPPCTAPYPSCPLNDLESPPTPKLEGPPSSPSEFPN